ncbi:MAG: tetratricopeptide repeat protein [Nitrospiraceae bacterium]|nr:tetratricopeptide repeat protein [Nitrospiraceae bacterium]
MCKRYLLIALLLLLATCLSCATAERKKKAELHYKLGLSRLESGQYQDAFVEFQKSLQNRSNDKRVYYALGYIYMKWDDTADAEKSFTKAIKIDPSFSQAYNDRCLLEYRQKKYERAVSDCNKALSNPLYETPEKAFFNLGLAYSKLGKYDKAIRAFRQCTIRMGDFYPAYYQLALAYNAKGDYGEAASALQLAVRLDPRFKGDMTKAENTFRRGEGLPGGSEDAVELMDIFHY